MVSKEELRDGGCRRAEMGQVCNHTHCPVLVLQSMYYQEYDMQSHTAQTSGRITILYSTPEYQRLQFQENLTHKMKFSFFLSPFSLGHCFMQTGHSSYNIHYNKLTQVGTFLFKYLRPIVPMPQVPDFSGSSV